MDEQRTHEFRKARRAACRAERDPADPVAFEFEHEETGEVKFIEAIQVEIGFQEENPRWQLIGPVYAQAPVVAVNEQLLEALRDFSNYVHAEQSSTDGHVQYSNTQINRLAFKARSAIAAAEAAKGGV